MGQLTLSPAWEEEHLVTGKGTQSWQGDAGSLPSLPWAIPAACAPRPTMLTLAFWASSDT